MDIDLDENNYDYNDLLELFNITSTFNLKDLKQAKKKVLMLHPDKCKIDIKYYLFFRKMYLKLEEIYNFTTHEKDEENLKKVIDTDSHFKDYLERNKIDPKNNYKLFSKEFNTMFEKVYISENNDGYEDWLKSEKGIYNKDDLEESRKIAIQEKALIKKTEHIEELGNLERQNLYYSDIKETHGIPFIALDIEEEFNKKPKFNSVQEFEQYVSKQDNTPISEQQSNLYLNNKEKMLEQQSKELAYSHMKQKEQMNSNYKNYVSKYLKINN